MVPKDDDLVSLTVSKFGVKVTDLKCTVSQSQSIELRVMYRFIKVSISFLKPMSSYAKIHFKDSFVNDKTSCPSEEK